MFAMQYGFNLTNLDQLSIRERVHEIGGRFDNLPGLYQKAFLMAERLGEDSNRYTPFYLWDKTEEMSAFLLSESFGRVVSKWGRPVVSRWNQVCHLKGDATGARPRFAIQRHISVPLETDLDAFCSAYQSEVHAMAQLAGLHSAFLGIDTENWQLMSITLWDSEVAAQGDGDRYEVLYLSAQK